MREYLRIANQEIGEDGYTTHGPKNRYALVLYCEKEGFDELFGQTQLAARYDLAIGSSKGENSTSARELLEGIGQLAVNILVVHDFDVKGFSILGTLRRDTARFKWTHPPNIIDLGLRLADVKEWNLESEPKTTRDADIPTLRRNGATAAEVEFLKRQRVELNAFTSPQLIAWLEKKFAKHGVEKVVPHEKVLERVSREILRDRYRDELLEKFMAKHSKEIEERAKGAVISSNLGKRVRKLFRQNPVLSWHQALVRVLEE